MENPIKLWDKEQIQNTGTSICDYMDSPLRKINITSITLYQITQDDNTQQWLQSERDYLEKII